MHADTGKEALIVYQQTRLRNRRIKLMISAFTGFLSNGLIHASDLARVSDQYGIGFVVRRAALTQGNVLDNFLNLRVSFRPHPCREPDPPSRPASPSRELIGGDRDRFRSNWLRKVASSADLFTSHFCHLTRLAPRLDRTLQRDPRRRPVSL